MNPSYYGTNMIFTRYSTTSFIRNASFMIIDEVVKILIAKLLYHYKHISKLLYLTGEGGNGSYEADIRLDFSS